MECLPTELAVRRTGQSNVTIFGQVFHFSGKSGHCRKRFEKSPDYPSQRPRRTRSARSIAGQHTFPCPLRWLTIGAILVVLGISSTSSKTHGKAFGNRR